MRVIGGEWRGRRLQAPPGKHTRPLTDRIKQSLFDVLGQRLDDQVVIDICAGSGAFGIEAASRGAAKVILIDNDATAQATIRANLRQLGQPHHVRLAAGNLEQVLPTLPPADLIFADPPFPWFQQQPERITALIQQCLPCCRERYGQLVIRGERGQQLPADLTEWQLTDHRWYGRSWVSWLSPQP